jgi:CBS domain-containing protein
MVTENGKLGSKLIGIVTNRDIQFEDNLNQPVSSVMVKDLITATDGTTLSEANTILAKSKKGKLPIIDSEVSCPNVLEPKLINQPPLADHSRVKLTENIRETSSL